MKHSKIIIITLFMLILVACQQEGDPTPTLMPTAGLPESENNGVDGVAEEISTESEAVDAEENTAVSDSEAEPAPTDIPPTATPKPAKEMTICMAQEPQSLFWYGDDSLAATSVRHALYENLITSRDYSYQAQGIIKLPLLGEGDAAIEKTAVFEGDLVVNSAGNVVPLLPGTQIINAEGEFVTFDSPREGDPLVEMQQMIVDFAFHPMTWSDGTPVNAQHSVFAFELAKEMANLDERKEIERTLSYQATGEQTVRWTGLPGYLSSEYFLNVWTPLPLHLYEDLTLEEILNDATVNDLPLSTGPYMVTEWIRGESLTLTANPYYYRDNEGFPAIDRVTVLFDPDVDPIADIASGGCDLVTQDGVTLAQIPALLDGETAGEIRPYFVPSPVFEHVDFGVDSWQDYGDDNSNGRPDWFEYLPVRQAITQCIDRQRMVDELLSGQGQVMNSYIPNEHPLYPVGSAEWAYDPAGANAALDEFGLEDTDGDGIRELVERDLSATIVATTTMSITLGTDSESDIRLRINEMIQEDLVECGIEVNLYDVPAEKWYDDGPFSVLFGRRFDLATYAWLTGITPPCSLYLSTNITGPEEQGFGGWGNINATGWANDEYDLACQAALDALPGTDNYINNHMEAASIFSARMPAIPLFQYIKTAVSAPTIQNINPNSSQPSELWNIFEWDIEE